MKQIKKKNKMLHFGFISNFKTRKKIGTNLDVDILIFELNF